MQLSPTIALDRNGRVAERYGATSIPQTVIVGRDGTVARLFVGGGARFDEQLREALRSVLGDTRRPRSRPARRRRGTPTAKNQTANKPPRIDSFDPRAFCSAGFEYALNYG